MKAFLSPRYGLDALELREVDKPVIEDDRCCSASTRRP